MKKLLFLISLPLVALTGCKNNPDPESVEMKINLTSKNFSEYFKVTDDQETHKTIIQPRFEKHLLYKNITFSYTSTYYYREYTSQYTWNDVEESYDFSIKLDSKGSGSASHGTEEHASLIDYDYWQGSFTKKTKLY